MKLKTRFSSSGFIEIKVDEVETTIYKDSLLEIELLIENLESVIDDLKKIATN